MRFQNRPAHLQNESFFASNDVGGINYALYSESGLLDLLSEKDVGINKLELEHAQSFAATKRLRTKTKPDQVEVRGRPNAPANKPLERFVDKKQVKGAGGKPFIDLDKPLGEPDMDKKRSRSSAGSGILRRPSICLLYTSPSPRDLG